MNILEKMPRIDISNYFVSFEFFFLFWFTDSFIILPENFKESIFKRILSRSLIFVRLNIYNNNERTQWQLTNVIVNLMAGFYHCRFISPILEFARRFFFLSIWNSFVSCLKFSFVSFIYPAFFLSLFSFVPIFFNPFTYSVTHNLLNVVCCLIWQFCLLHFHLLNLIYI